VRLRRARTLFTYWSDDGRVVIANYRTRSAYEANPNALRALSFFHQWRRAPALAARLSQYDPQSVQRSVRQLARAGLLVGEGTPEARADARIADAWSAWLPYGAFHFGTKDQPFLKEHEIPPLLRRQLRESRQPPCFKRYPASARRRLPALARRAGEFPRVLLARRTHREFARGAVPLQTIADLLRYTWGVTGYGRSPTLGWLPEKTSPSGGARHPGEVYLFAPRVDGLAPGIYHYDSRRHALDLVRRGATGAQASRYCADQRYVAAAPAVFFMTAVVPRVMWKYRFARAYRVMTLDAGHLGQTFCLTATWLGLAPFCTAALRDSLLERDLKIDGVTEVAMYAVGVGLPLVRRT
jgi:SagB-type dehydrogenase family enzyme